MLGSPELLVLDEPTVGLDPVLRAELWSLFRGARRRRRDDHRVEPRHGRGAALRPADAHARRPHHRRHDPDGLLADTGRSDPDAAFLALVERDEAAAHAAEPGIRSPA